MLPRLGTIFDDKPNGHHEYPASSDQRADQGQRVCLDPCEGLTNFVCLSLFWCHGVTHFLANGLQLVEQMATVITFFTPPHNLCVDLEHPVS